MLSRNYLGLSMEGVAMTFPDYFSPANRDLVQLFKLMGPSILRLGAGSVEEITWKGFSPVKRTLDPAMIDRTANFVAETGWTIVHGIDFARNSPANAADEAAYVSQRYGDRLRALEFGNEVNGYPSNVPFGGHRPTTWRYPDFFEEWHALYEAVSRAVPRARFVGPSTVGNYEWAQRFAGDAGSLIAELTHHYYIDDGAKPTSTIEKMLAPDPFLERMTTDLVQTAASHGIRGGLVLNEANNFYNYGSDAVSNTYASAFWVIDFTFRTALAGCRGINIHCTGTGQGYAPLVITTGGQVLEVRPEFYGMVLLSRAMEGRVVQTEVETFNTEAPIRAYGVARSDGGRNVVLTNTDARSTVPVELDLGIMAAELDPLYLEGPSLAATSGQTLNGSSIRTDGTFAPGRREPLRVSGGRAVVSVPPLTAILLKSR